MAQKKRKSKKKKSSKRRRNSMPAGLKAYWAKRRKAKTRRKATRSSRRVFPARYDRRLAEVIAAMKNPRRRKRKSARRRVRRNPRPTVRKIYAPKGLAGKGLQQFRRTVARLTGKRTRIVSR